MTQHGTKFSCVALSNMPEPTQEQTRTTTVVAPVRELHLTGEDEGVNDSGSRRHVAWTDDTIDNEFMDKKKSKICCIFHPQGEFEEQEEPESGSSSSSDSSDSDNGGDHDHEHCNHSRKSRKTKGKAKLPGPNAYEVQPKYKPIGSPDK